eukprot:g43720.t1
MYSLFVLLRGTFWLDQMLELLVGESLLEQEEKGHFEQNASRAASPVPTAPDTTTPSITAVDVRSAFLGVNPRKVMGLDRLPIHALRSCVDQLAEVFTDIFTLSLLQAKAPTCFKKTTTIPLSDPEAAISEDRDNCTSSMMTLNAGAPKGCVLSPLRYSLYTHDCVAKFRMKAIYKFVENTTV